MRHTVNQATVFGAPLRRITVARGVLSALVGPVGIGIPSCQRLEPRREISQKNALTPPLCLQNAGNSDQ